VSELEEALHVLEHWFAKIRSRDFLRLAIQKRPNDSSTGAAVFYLISQRRRSETCSETDRDPDITQTILYSASVQRQVNPLT
jgi:hypothetical protein